MCAVVSAESLNTYDRDHPYRERRPRKERSPSPRAQQADACMATWSSAKALQRAMGRLTSKEPGMPRLAGSHHEHSQKPTLLKRKMSPVEGHCLARTRWPAHGGRRPAPSPAPGACRRSRPQPRIGRACGGNLAPRPRVPGCEHLPGNEAAKTAVRGRYAPVCWRSRTSVGKIQVSSECLQLGDITNKTRH